MFMNYIVSLSFFFLISLLLLAAPLADVGRKFPRWFMYWNSEKANDNSQNWSCHNYAHNLMRTAEPNSIFMTEGGDNQVFSLLYFAYVERKRPDIDFFDQKGNVFPRLYGDLMNTHPIDLELIRDLRDFQLYSTGRPVYLTWKRPNLHLLNASFFAQKIKELKQRYPQFSQYITSKWKLDTLSEIENALENMVPIATFNKKMKVGGNLKKQHLRYLGPWYFKNYGILFKVTPIKYAIVDALEVYQEAPVAILIPYVKKVSQINLTASQIEDYAQELIQEGYIKKSGGKYQLVKPHAPPYHDNDLNKYWEGYTFDYTNAPNSKHWDFLTREIFRSYNVLQANYNFDQQKLLVEKSGQITPPEKRIEYLTKANEHQHRGNQALELGCFYGHDMSYMQYHYATALMGQGKTDEAIKYFKKAGEIEKDMYQPIAAIGEYYLKESTQVSAGQEAKMLTKAIEYSEEAKQRMEMHAIKYGRVAKNDKNYAGYYNHIQLNIIDKSKARLKHPRTDLEKAKRKAESGDEKDLEILIDIHVKRAEFDEALKNHDELLKKKPDNYQLMMKRYNLARQFNPGLSIQVLENILNRFDDLEGANPAERPKIVKQCGQFYLSQGEQLITQANTDINAVLRAEALFKRSQQYLTLYRNWGMGVLEQLKNSRQITQANELKRDLIQIEKQLNHIAGRINVIENVKKQQDI